MFRDAPVLILDEPADERATIVISHDLSTAREATEILFLEDRQTVGALTREGRLLKKFTHPHIVEPTRY
jgi:ABC-type transport system involved in Fe-S cluster assembly fused permease/ATPase subunit